MSFLGKLLSLLEKKGLIKMKIKVMILDPARGVVTDYWDYDEHKHLADKWVGKDGTLYMLCAYKNGAPEYFATNKEIFDLTKQKMYM